MAKLIFCLMGPTAAGKTSLSLELVQAFPFEIISVDSAMIYRGMNIGTAKPSLEELQLAPHHLIDILDPIENYSAAQFCEDAIEWVEDIYKREKIPLLVGGTMMYFNALQQGLSLLPQSDEAIRLNLLKQAERHGWSYLHEQLKGIDPLSAARIHPNDTQRIQRALEVYALTGKTLSFFWSEQKGAANYQFINIGLFPKSRAWLHDRIARRFNLMLEQDLIGEVAELLQKWQLPATCPSMRSVGYRQVINYLAGDYDYESLRQKGIVATRQLAKRQLTWLRNWPDAFYFDCEDPFKTQEEIIALIQQTMDNKSGFKH